MGRILLLLLFAAIVAVVFRPARERIQPHVQFALDPMYEWSARNRVVQLKNMLDEEKQMGRPLPRPGEFLSFVGRRDPSQGGGIDPWGNPYYMNATSSTYQVGSAGRDGIPRTADDILSPVGQR